MASIQNPNSKPQAILFHLFFISNVPVEFFMAGLCNNETNVPLADVSPPTHCHPHQGQNKSLYTFTFLFKRRATA